MRRRDEQRRRAAGGRWRPPAAGGRTRRLRAHQVDAAVEAAAASCAAGVGQPAAHLVEALAGGVGDGPGGDGGHVAVDRALARALTGAVGGAWQRGWQPADLHRAVERLRGRAHGRLAVAAAARDVLRHPRPEIPPRWLLQLDAMGAADPPGDDGSGGWVTPGRADGPARAAGDGVGGVGGADRGGAARLAGLVVAVETLAALRALPVMPRIGPVPGDPAPARRSGPPVGADPRILHKVTALLAKAESTTFPDEAEALTAKAQELMTRHAIDRAALDARQGGAPVVAARRLGIDDPYAGARYLLLSAVAEANRCRAVWSRFWGFATVFGDEGDLDAVELLYTSLLVQATRSMVAAGRPRGASGGRTRSFRQSFLVAFARRIGARLREADAAVTAREARRSAALVPVFERRKLAADAAVDEAFPRISTTRMSANDAAGWHAGTEAADRAQLDLHEALRRERAAL
ncbi:MAG TPA: DUF2786 domain-containing protein [Acidimicrobiales bacterium]|nr:DUF2786 domain-containing protein [Acidimicrobiales bacterium]